MKRNKAKAITLPPKYIVRSNQPMTVPNTIWVEKHSGKNKIGILESFLILIKKIINR